MPNTSAVGVVILSEPVVMDEYWVLPQAGPALQRLGSFGITANCRGSVLQS